MKKFLNRLRNRSGAGAHGEKGEGAAVADVLRTLVRLRDNRIFLQARVSGDDAQYSTLILNVRPEKGQLLLDELYPSDDPLVFPRGTEMRLFHQVGGKGIEFHTHVVRSRLYNGSPLHNVQIPDVILPWQRRAAVRVRPHAGQDIYILVAAFGGTVLNCRVVDLSATGLRFVTTRSIRDITHHLNEEIPIRDCLLRIDDELQVPCTMLPRTLKVRSTPKPHAEFGVELLDLDKQSEETLHQFVHKRQLEARRSATRTSQEDSNDEQA